MTIWRVTVGVVVLALAGLAVLLCMGWESSTEPDVAWVSGGSSGDRARRERVRPPAVESGTALERQQVLRIGIDVAEPGTDVAWRCELYVQPTRSNPREQIAVVEGRGSDEVVWEVGPIPLEVRLVSDDAAGGSLQKIGERRQDAAAVRFQLVPYARVTGEIRDAEGAGVPGARVLLVAATATPQRPSEPLHDSGDLTPTLTATSGGDGRFTIDRVDARLRYHAAATHPGFAVRRVLGLAPEPAETLEVAFELRPGHRIVGRLLSPAGLPLADGEVLIATAIEEPGGVTWDREGESTTSADGAFRFDSLGDGWKKLEFRGYTSESSALVYRAELEITGPGVTDLGDVRIPDNTLEARIVDPEGRNPECRVTLVHLPLDSPRLDRSGAMLVLPLHAKDGVIRVHGLPPGRVEARLYAQEDWPAGMHRPKTEVVTHLDEGPTQVEWQLAPFEPTPERSGGHELFEVEFPEGAPGDVCMLIIDGEIEVVAIAGTGCSFQIATGATVRMVATRGARRAERTVTVHEAQSMEFDAPFDQRGNEIEVRVSQGGRGVPGAEVAVGAATNLQHGHVGAMVGRTDRDGVFRMGGVPPDLELAVGVHVLHAAPPGRAVTYVGGKAILEFDIPEE